MSNLSSDRNSLQHNRKMVELSADLLPSILHFCNDNTLLNTTSLVCRGWHDVSRYLFVKDRLVIQFDGTNDAFDRIRNLIHHASTFRWNHINHITFKLGWRFQEDWIQGEVWNIKAVLERRADQFIHTLMPLVEMTGDSVRSLSIHFLKELSDTASHFTTPLLSLYPRITHLELQCARQSWSLANIIQIVRPLRDLKILSTSDIDTDVHLHTLPANIPKLFIRDRFNSERHRRVLGVLSRPHSTLNGRHVVTQDLDFCNASRNILRWTRCLNLTIESMRFGHILTEFKLYRFFFDFSQFTQLKSLTFDVTTDRGTPSIGREKSYIADFNARLYQSLRTIKSLHLEEIVLVVAPDVFDYPEVWVAIDRLLSLARFPSIQGVTFLVHADSYNGATHESLVSLATRSFSHCLAAGRKVNVEMIGEKDALEVFKQDVLHYLPPTACTIIVGTRNSTS